MALKYSASVEIGGVYLGSREDDDQIGIREISIPWGRDKITDDTNPKTATIRFIDRTTSWAVDRARQSEPVVIRRNPDGLVIFRGVVSKVTAKFTETVNPRSKMREPALDVTMTVQDIPGSIFADVVNGDSTNPNTPEGLGGWVEKAAGNRRSAILAAGLDKHVEGWDSPGYRVGDPDTASAPTTVIPRWRARPAADNLSLGEIVAHVARTWPLGFINYNPRTRRIDMPTYGQAGHLELRQDTGKLRLVTAATVAQVPASKLSVPDGIEISVGVSDDIDVVRHTYTYYGYLGDVVEGEELPDVGYTSGVVERPTASAAAGRRRVLEVETDTMQIDGRLFADPALQASYSRFHNWWLDQVIPMLNSVAGYLQPVSPRVDFELVEFEPAIADLLWSAWQRPQAIYLQGALTNHLTHAARQVQIIGGTFTYDDKGWHHTLKLAPAIGAARANLTIQQGIGAATITYANTGTVTFADLAAATKGLS